MNTPSDAIPESLVESQGVAPAVLISPRPLYWSMRRELWENRSIYIAPLAAAGVGVMAFLIGLGFSHSMRHKAEDAPDRQVMLVMPYAHAVWLLLATSLTVGFFYCLDALNGERRDRSILFWKSLPVSDLITVLAKASIPLVVLPLLVFAIAVTTHLIMLPVNAAALLASGAAATLRQLPLFQMELVLLYGLTVLALWHAPLYGWLLLVSAWARRAAFLWAVLPLAALCAFERIAFRTSYFSSLLEDRLYGFAEDAFALHGQTGVPVDPHLIPLAALTPGRFLSTPGLWIGLACAAIFVAAAARMRRCRDLT
jgi:ABC-2 type transport system permease protein